MKKRTGLFYSILILAAILTIAKIFLPSVQKIFLKEFHLQESSFARWAVQHHLPSMYSFNNEVWYSPVISSKKTIASNLPINTDTTWHGWYNHFPLRMITFTLNRKTFFRDAPIQYLSLKSSFRSTDLVTHFTLIQKNNILILTHDP